MSVTLTRPMLVLLGLRATISASVGAAPAGAGYRLDMADGTSRAATAAEIDAATAWADARAAEAAADDTDTATVRGDAQVRSLMMMTPAQIEAWGAANIGNLAQARAAIIVLAKAVSMLARRVLR